jgi:hypothetical protein
MVAMVAIGLYAVIAALCLALLLNPPYHEHQSAGFSMYLSRK